MFTATTIATFLATAFFVLMLAYRAKGKDLRRTVEYLCDQQDHLFDEISAQQREILKLHQAQVDAVVLKYAKYKEGDTVTIHGHEWTVAKVFRKMKQEAFCKTVAEAITATLYNQRNPQNQKPISEAKLEYGFEYLLNTTIGRSTVRIKLTEADLCEVQKEQTEAVKSNPLY